MSSDADQGSLKETLDNLAESNRENAWIYEWYRNRVESGEAELPSEEHEDDG